ncbi:MAG: ROK family protein [Gemmataceae bacterium]
MSTKQRTSENTQHVRDGAHWIGVDLGGTKVLAGLFDDDLKVLSRCKLPTEPEKGEDHIFGQIRSATEGVLSQSGVAADQVRGLGLGIPGQIDPIHHVVRYAPNLGWNDVPLRDRLQSHCPWPTFVQNDVQVGTYGEYVRGAAQGAKHVLGIFVGTGVGGGLVINGEIYHGFNYSAGEIGHTIIHWKKGQSLESIAGRRAMMQRAEKMLADSPKKERKHWKDVKPAKIKSSQMAKMYADQDPIIVELIDEAAEALGAAIGSCLNLLSPEIIVIGGGVAGALGQPFLDKIWEIALKYSLPRSSVGVKLVPAALADDSGIVGAAALVRAKVLAGVT